MRSMTLLPAILLLMAPCAAMASHAPRTSLALPASFTGTARWSTGDTGALLCRLDSAGNATGLVVDETASTAGEMTGIITPAGAANITLTFSGAATSFTGSLSVSASGQLAGTLTSGSGGLTLALTPDASTAGGYAGSYVGVVHSSFASVAVFALTVDGSGNAVSLAIAGTQGAPVTATGTVDSQGNTSLSEFWSGQTYAVAGKLALNSWGLISTVLKGPAVNQFIQLFPDTTTSSANPFTGTFLGTTQIGSDPGAMLLSVDTSGNVYGLVIDSSSGAPGIMIGTIPPSGAASLTEEFSNTITTLSGTVAVSSARQLTGSLTGDSTTLGITLNPF
ncbi:MAG: hypothetical protein ACLQVD_02205 [Capsulimonadaceae bacterium]